MEVHWIVMSKTMQCAITIIFLEKILIFPYRIHETIWWIRYYNAKLSSFFKNGWWRLNLGTKQLHLKNSSCYLRPIHRAPATDIDTYSNKIHMSNFLFNIYCHLILIRKSHPTWQQWRQMLPTLECFQCFLYWPVGFDEFFCTLRLLT